MIFVQQILNASSDKERNVASKRSPTVLDVANDYDIIEFVAKVERMA